MQRTMLKSKIHRATITDASLDYVGSITLDEELMTAADILPHEQVQVLDITNGARFETYAIVGEAGSGTVCVNGAAARLVQRGDKIIIITYAVVDEAEAKEMSTGPIVVHVDEHNHMLPSVENPGPKYESAGSQNH